MSKNSILWHPYSKEKPSKINKAYLVTVKRKNIEPYVDYCNYVWFKHAEEFGFCCFDDVIAWAELPEPYTEDYNADSN